MTTIGIILGSTRPGRVGVQVGAWVHEIASRRADAEFELIDLLDHDLPHMDEPIPPAMDQYSQPHTLAWAEKIAPFDGFIIVTPEYNHMPPGGLTDALDYLNKEWNNKAVGFVSYGVWGGSNAVGHLRSLVGQLQLADVKAQLTLYLDKDFENFSVFQPTPRHERDLTTVLEQTVTWSNALAPLRQPVLA
ncbi:NAD(P)H-dependent oxidoreductase [Actinoplanes sp. TBRC 11911]|uniref:NADPH-dependent FMN reductase n=1 Tax=Actinoplanes sp. TBRC 11911 TaxID=2729386 RepID=UPI00145CFE3E|nr:NAD(P)H-dependent oxidoreductase [Actinoplanes sp. TBRC 11911]NMO56141.1 NAD(P)H-dependent oxidoreductase [Actinoplanes sp. TBRC 11911]